jgi:hypothetical protein
VLAVVPISDRYIAAVRSFAPNDGKRHPTLIAIDSAEAIAASAKPPKATNFQKERFGARRLSRRKT